MMKYIYLLKMDYIEAVIYAVDLKRLVLNDQSCIRINAFLGKCVDAARRIDDHS